MIPRLLFLSLAVACGAQAPPAPATAPTAEPSEAEDPDAIDGAKDQAYYMVQSRRVRFADVVPDLEATWGIDHERATELAREAVARVVREQGGPPNGSTDVERLAAAFVALRERGVLAHHLNGLAHIDAYDMALPRLRAAPDAPGIVFHIAEHLESDELPYLLIHALPAVAAQATPQQALFEVDEIDGFTEGVIPVLRALEAALREHGFEPQLARRYPALVLNEFEWFVPVDPESGDPVLLLED